MRIAQRVRRRRRIADELVRMHQRIAPAVKPGNQLLLGHLARRSMKNHVLVAPAPMGCETKLFGLGTIGGEMRQIPKDGLVMRCAAERTG